METFKTRVQVGEDGRLRVDIPAKLPPGPVEVVVVVQSVRSPSRDIRELRGLGEEIWRGIDAQEYVNRLRDEWER